MEITFTKESERDYRSIAKRSDGVTLHVGGVGRWIGLPHDYAHFLIEHALKLEYGFWGQISKGALFPSVRIISGRQKPHACERSRTILKDNHKGSTHAEVMVRLFCEITEQGLDSNAAAAQHILREARDPPKGGKPDFTRELVLNVCSSIRKEEERWKKLPIGQSVTVTWKEKKNSRR
jgi:hypothetical protein